MRTAVRRLPKLEARLGCDHRAVFATTYRVLTQALLQTLREQPGFFRFPRYFYFEEALFADVYIANSNAPDRKRRVSPAWRIAFETAPDGDLTGAQDMLLGINAHVQNDMPFVIAALDARRGAASRASPTTTPRTRSSPRPTRGSSRGRASLRPGGRRHQPRRGPADDAAGLELVKQWREQVWQNAGG